MNPNRIEMNLTRRKFLNDLRTENPPPKKLTAGAAWLVFVLGIFLSPAAVVGLELPRGFVEETLATNLNAMTSMALVPDGRILLADQTGKLLIWKAGKLLGQPALQLHVTDYWERGLIGVTLHPDFPRVPHVFILYVTDRPFVHHVLSRFSFKGDILEPGSEVVLLEGDDQAKRGGPVPAGHQGGPLRFGADGKIYVGIGEQTAGEPSQWLDTFQGKILRLNPDGSIPEENPFYQRLEGKYRAIFALGVRNPFGLAVQKETSRIFFTDVGGSAFEEVNELLPGANYGWPHAEGYSTNAEFKSPLYAYPPMIGRGVCGGAFYPRQGPFPSKWSGQFFFLDYMNNWLKALDPTAPTNVMTFARGFNGPIAVEAGGDGCLYVLNRGTIWRDMKKFTANSGSLVRIRYAGETNLTASELSDLNAVQPGNPLKLPARSIALPKRWSAAGLDGALSVMRETGRLIEYEVNAPEWEPGITVKRMMILPRSGKIRFSKDDDWRFPIGTVFIRYYFAEPRSKYTGLAKPLEKRLIVIGQPRGYGASYRVTPDGLDAELIEDGDSVVLPPTGAAGKSRLWFFPAIDEGLNFPASSFAYRIDANTRQLNREVAGGKNQLAVWNQLGLFDPPLDEDDLANLPRLASLENVVASPVLRVRSYLEVNCAVCHQPGGASRGLFDARFVTPLEKAGILNGPLAAGDLGISGACVVLPGDPERSILYQRLKHTDFFRMPPVQFHDQVSPILPVLEEWIRSLKPLASVSKDSAARNNR